MRERPILASRYSEHAKGQEDEHEGDAATDHLHAVAHGVGVIEQKHGEEDEEQAVDGDREKDAGAQPSVVSGE